MSTLYSISHKQKHTQAHETDARWGGNPGYWFLFRNNNIFTLERFVQAVKPLSILDYGCGKGLALNQLKTKFPHIAMVNYDPFVVANSEIPKQPCDLVVCYNVLQLVELEFLDQTIEQIYNLSTKNILLSMNSSKYREQTHIDWWRKRLSHYNIIADSNTMFHTAYPIGGEPYMIDSYNFWISKNNTGAP